MANSWRISALAERHRALGSKLEDWSGMGTAWTYASDLADGDRKSNRMSTSMAHVWGVSGMHTGDCWVDFSKPVARDFSV